MMAGFTRAAAVLGRLPAHRLVAAAAIFLALSQGAVFALAAETHRISQKGRAFDRRDLAVARGDLVQFGNDDEFIHQIYIQSSDLNVDSAESSPGDTIDVRFPYAGAYEVRCHIHPKMLLVVTVK